MAETHGILVCTIDEPQPTLSFLQLQVLHEVLIGEQAQEQRARLRIAVDYPDGEEAHAPLIAGMHVEAGGSSGVFPPAGYAGEEADRQVRAYTATMLRRIADALDAHVASAQMPVIVTSADQDPGPA